MPRYTLTDLANLQNETTATTAINNNNTVTENALDDMLSRVATTGNAMQVDLDMNSKRVINLPVPLSASDAARKADLDDIVSKGVAVNTVTNAYLADMANATIKGRITAGTGDPEDLTATQVRTLIDFNESVDDRVAALLVAGSNITLNYNDVANTLTITSANSQVTNAWQATGVTADGATDDAAALNTAITNLPVGGILDGGGKTYKVNSSLVLKSNITIRNFVFDFTSAATGDKLLEGIGTLGTSVGVTAGGVRYGQTFSLASDPGIAVGDYLWIRSGDTYEINSNAAEGEFIRVLTKSGNDYTIRDGFHSTYTTTPVMYKPTFIQNVRLENIRATGAGVLANGASGKDQYGVHFDYGRNIIIDNCHFDKFDLTGIELRACYNVVVSRCSVTRVYDSGAAATTGGNSYGVACVHGTMHVRITGCYFEDMRHCIMTGGTEGVNRYIIATGNTMNGCRAAGMDTHGATELVYYSGNIISAAVGEISTSSQNGIQHFGGTAVISGNIIRGFWDSGITHQCWVNRVNVGSIITGNVIEYAGSALGTAGIFIDVQTPIRMTSVNISNNRIHAENLVRGIFVNIEDANMDFLTITNNTINKIAGPCIEITVATGRILEIFNISGNVGRNTLTTNGCIIISTATATNTNFGTIVSNVMFGGSHGIVTTNTDYLNVSANVFRGYATAATNIVGAANKIDGTNVT